MRRPLALALLALPAAGCVGDDEPAVGTQRSAIYHGVRARGYVGTVRVKKLREVFGFNSCSGTVVAPRVVLTARHCLVDAQPIDLSVETGSEGELGQFGVAELRTTEGPLFNDNDFAILVMADRVDAPPVPWARTWEPIEEAPITLVGYGLTDNQFVGIKHEGYATVDTFTDVYFVTRGDENGCYGDSGGTGLDDTGTLVGVITHILYGPFPEDVCEGGRTGLNRVDAHAAMIDQAIADSTICEDAEICGDEVDDDCDGATDDGCLVVGDPCADPSQCQSGDCRSFGGDPVCTALCTPGSFVDECPPPTECRRLPDGGGACLDDPVELAGADAGPGADAGVSVDAGAGADEATYGCGCRTTGGRGGAGWIPLIPALSWAAGRRWNRKSGRARQVRP
jgi:hypothetical protein